MGFPLSEASRKNGRPCQAANADRMKIATSAHSSTGAGSCLCGVTSVNVRPSSPSRIGWAATHAENFCSQFSPLSAAHARPASASTSVQARRTSHTRPAPVSQLTGGPRRPAPSALPSGGATSCAASPSSMGGGIPYSSPQPAWLSGPPDPASPHAMGPAARVGRMRASRGRLRMGFSLYDDR